MVDSLSKDTPQGEPATTAGEDTVPRHYLHDFRKDEYINFATGLGDPFTDTRIQTSFHRPRDLHQQELEDLYLYNDLAGLIAQLFPSDMTREWIALDCSGLPTFSADVLDALATLKACAAFAEALTWERAYGGGLIVIGLDDAGSRSALGMRAPVDWSNINRVTFLHVYDRFDAKPIEWHTDGNDVGEPAVYEIRKSPGEPPIEVHASRTIRFDGADFVPRRYRQKNDGWGMPVYNRVNPILRDYGLTWGTVNSLMKESGLLVLKMKGFSSLVANDAEQLIPLRLQALNAKRTGLHIFVVDAEHEELQRLPLGIEGLPPMFDRFASRLAAATRYPVTLLFGQSPAGLQATGDANIRHYYDDVHSRQENRLRGPLEYLIRLLLASREGPTQGKTPDAWSMKFSSLYQLTDAEQADIRQKQAQADALYVQNGVVDPEEVAQSRFGGSSYSTDTTLSNERRAGDDLTGLDDDGGPNA